DHGGDVDELAQAGPVLGLARDQLEEPEVAHDRHARSAPLHLDDDLLAGLESGDVHLSDRPGGERLRLDRLDHVLQGTPSSSSITETTSSSLMGVTLSWSVASS